VYEIGLGWEIVEGRLRDARSEGSFMANGLNRVLEVLHRTVRRQGGEGLSDACLLGRYIRHRDDAAFEGLLRRHGAMVFGVCRRLLPTH
jgi:hypothetical protein